MRELPPRPLLPADLLNYSECRQTHPQAAEPPSSVLAEFGVSGPDMESRKTFQKINLCSKIEPCFTSVHGDTDAVLRMDSEDWPLLTLPFALPPQLRAPDSVGCQLEATPEAGHMDLPRMAAQFKPAMRISSPLRGSLV